MEDWVVTTINGPRHELWNYFCSSFFQFLTFCLKKRNIKVWKMSFWLMFSLNSLKIFDKILYKRLFEPAISCVRDQDATTAPARHTLNWLQFMLQWFVRFPNIAEFIHFPFHFGKSPYEQILLKKTRMHFSRMCTTLFNGRLSCNPCPSCHTCPLICMPPATHAPYHACPPLWTDRHL